MRRHERYVIETLGIGDITAFYSSEPYGEHMSRAIGAADRRVDVAPTQVPVSASAVRSDPYANRAYLDPRVYRSLITNVVLLGAPGTGKSMLAERLAREFGTSWMPEYGREYWEANAVDRRLRPDQLRAIARGHLEREDAALASSPDLDITTVAWVNSEEGMGEGVIAAGNALGLIPSFADTWEAIAQKTAEAAEAAEAAE